MIRAIQKKIESALKQILERDFALKDHPIPEAQYPDPGMGDLSYTLVFALAKSLKKNPKIIAQQLADAFPLKDVQEVRSVEVGGNGFLNFRLNRPHVASELYRNPLTADPMRHGKAIVEHTNINPNKAAHVGHLRNAVLGDTVVKLLEFLGTPVEVQNYIDDTGVQLADVVVGFQRAGKTMADLDRIEGKMDNYFWDLYAETHHWLEQSAENKLHREAALKAMEGRDGEVFELSQAIADRIIRCHLETMKRIGIDYQLLPRESDIIGKKFWARTFELLKEKGAIVQVEEGKNRGCWVMKLAQSEGFEDMQNPDKIIVRSNGVVTYVGKDIAYQLWKFGLLGLDFDYRVFERNPDGSVLWATTTTGGEPNAPHFGGASTVYNVIDQRQSYLQKVVAEGLRALGYSAQADRSIHFSYEMVTLSPKTARLLGYELSAEQEQKSFVEMSGRKGLGVKADDLLDRLRQVVLQRTAESKENLETTEREELAGKVATAALRYFMVKYTRNTVINFDMEEALSVEGETGPYLQYALVRARSIFRKLHDSGFDPDSEFQAMQEAVLAILGDEKDEEGEGSWQIVISVIRMKDFISRTLRSLEISSFAKHVFELAQQFNNYYHKYPILHEQDRTRKALRAMVVKMFADGMQTCLDLLGIPVPSRM